LLDEVEPDPDLEDTADDEPWLGSPPWPPGKYALDAEHDPSDDEPSLGSNDRHVNQANCVQGRSFVTDGEQEHDGREPDSDLEDDERELDPAENGIGDQDGLEEQMGRAH
jgi:hypothetical protein